MQMETSFNYIEENYKRIIYEVGDSVLNIKMVVR